MPSRVTGESSACAALDRAALRSNPGLVLSVGFIWSTSGKGVRQPDTLVLGKAGGKGVHNL